MTGEQLLQNHNNRMFYTLGGVVDVKKRTVRRKAEKDAWFFDSWGRVRRSFKQPLEGDWVRISGRLMRLCVLSGSSFQICDEGDGGFCLFSNGGMSFSGTCGPLLARSKLEPTRETLAAKCWIFSADYVGAGRRIDGETRVRVWNLR